MIHKLFSFVLILIYSSCNLFSMLNYPSEFKIDIFECKITNNSGKRVINQNRANENKISIPLDSCDVDNCLGNNLDLVVFVKNAIKKYFNDKGENIDVKIYNISGLMTLPNNSVELKCFRSPIDLINPIESDSNGLANAIFKYCFDYLQKNKVPTAISVDYLKVGKTNPSNTPNSKKL